MIITIIQGLLMALADSVPGVSGSTIAFILGYYEKFLTSLHNFFSKDKILRIHALKYLIKFGLGWCFGMVGSILLLANLFDKHVYELSSLFLGLTIAAIPYILIEEKKIIKGNYTHLFFTIIGASLVIGLSWLRSNNVDIASFDFLNLTFTNSLYLVIVGFIAICAMLLPGMSGSSVLLIFGLYLPVINAIKEILHLHLVYIIPCLLLGIGVILGVVLASGSIKKALNNFRSQTIYLIAGLMIGSIYAIICSPATLEVPQDPLSFSTFNFIFFFFGGLILILMENYKNRKLNN